MKTLKILLVGLLMVQGQWLYSQQFSGQTNEVYINTKKALPNAVALPSITWLSPEQEHSTEQRDSVEIIARVYSSSILKSIILQIRVGQESMTEEFPLSEMNFAGQHTIKKKIPLSNGVNTIEIILENASGGKVSSSRFVESSKRVIVKKELPGKMATPLLFVKQNSVVFNDINNDGILNANEEASVKFILQNKGMVAGDHLTLSYSTDASKDIIVQPDPIARIEPGEEQMISARILAGNNIATGKIILNMVVMEPNGFDSDPVQIQFNAEEFKPPVITVTDALFSSVTGNKLERNKTAGLKVLVQNTGLGTAEDVKVILHFPDNIYFVGDRVTNIGRLVSGEAKKLDFEFIVTSRFTNTEVPVRISLEEKSGKYSSEKLVTAFLDQPLAAVQLDVVGKTQRGAITTMMLRSDVDINIPVNETKYPNRYALIIGNEDYSQFQPDLQSEQNVAFARNDANVFKQYLTNVGGVLEKNIYLLTDAPRGQITRELDRVCELAKLNANSEIIFYYAGHGLPDFETRKGYLIPVDVSGSNIRDGISLHDLYAKLASTKASRITVFLDACFSGGGRGENGLLAARTVKVKPTGDLVDGNIIVYTATSGEEVSLPLKKEAHGLFTYHLLRKFQQTKGDFTMQELQDYLGNEVPKSSLTENGMKQTPQILVSPKLDQNWMNWKF